MKNLLKWMRLTRYWHARLGVFASLLFLILVITGVVLNHTEGLKLDQRPVTTTWLMNWYGLKTHLPEQGFLLANGYALSHEGRWVLDGHVIERHDDPLLGAVALQNLRYLADHDGLNLYQPDGQKVDRLDASSLPGTPVEALGLRQDMVVIRTPKGFHASEDGGLTWQGTSATGVHWSRPVTLPARVQQQVRPLFAPSLPLERIMLDLHSGRIFGRFGPYLMDLSALILLGLALSGSWIFWKSRQRP